MWIFTFLINISSAKSDLSKHSGLKCRNSAETACPVWADSVYSTIFPRKTTYPSEDTVSERLWAPWRSKYIQGVDDDKGCVFCSGPRKDKTHDRDNLILHRGEHWFVLMNLYPYNNGHLMVVPYMHTSVLSDIDENTVVEMWRLLNACKRVLSETLHPEAFNVGMNLGRTAGAGIDQHIHMHIVPRWNGDTNLMPVLGKTKIISQDLWETYDQMKPLFDRYGNNLPAPT